jgi:hypothetical protein
MKESEGGIVQAQAEALKALLEQSRESQCRELRERAELQARELTRRARRQARERVSKAAHEERARLEREVRMVEAEIETEQRRRERERDLALIEAGHELLAETLAGRWEDRAGRAEWAEALMEEAQAVLFGREWTLEHPADWADEERDAALARAREHCNAQVTAKAVDALDAGLRIRSEGALVDLSIPGLLANVRTIEGELLAEFNRAAEGETS